MNTLPAIGDRVNYVGGLTFGPCTGTVDRIFPDFDPIHPYIEKPFDPGTWHVGVTVDEKPEAWPYDTDRFAPAVEDIEFIVTP